MASSDGPRLGGTGNMEWVMGDFLGSLSTTAKVIGGTVVTVSAISGAAVTMSGYVGLPARYEATADTLAAVKARVDAIICFQLLTREEDPLTCVNPTGD